MVTAENKKKTKKRNGITHCHLCMYVCIQQNSKPLELLLGHKYTCIYVLCIKNTKIQIVVGFIVQRHGREERLAKSL